jgi:ABC-type transport system involved in multi-copper enzyme maturation permease subunit
VNTAALAKELRALFPAFLAALVTIALAPQTAPSFHLRIVLLVAFLGPIVLGSMSIGHEYSHRTLTLMLSQPIGRARLFTTKAAVLISMVGAIALGVFLALPEGFARPEAYGQARAVLVLGPLCGLCIAPALSMLCRSPLAAVVFTVAIPGIVMLLAQIAATAMLGFRNPRAVEDFAWAVARPAIAVLCLAGALATWHLFRRLQAVEGHGELQLPAWLRAETAGRPAPRVHGPWSALIRKELRLQQLAYVVAVLYVLAAIGIWTLQVYAPEFPRIPIEALNVMCGGLLAILIGSVASAEERQLGTLPAQLLQPVAMWKQWAVKVGTVVGLSLLLAIALPLLVNALIDPARAGIPSGIRFVTKALVPVIILTSVSLYVSSLSLSGIRAMIAALPCILGGVFFGSLASAVMMRAAQKTVSFVPQPLPSPERIEAYLTIGSIADATLLGCLVILAVTAVWLAYLNHRRIDRPRLGFVLQAAVLAGVVVLVAVMPTIVFLVMQPRA